MIKYLCLGTIKNHPTKIAAYIIHRNHKVAFSPLAMKPPGLLSYVITFAFECVG
jgi:hypothetical protein